MGAITTVNHVSPIKPAAPKPGAASTPAKAPVGDSLSLSSEARQWSCTADINTKQYIGPEGATPKRTLANGFQKVVPIQCSYTCTSGDTVKQVKATHVSKFMTESDEDLSCLGVTYTKQWVNMGPGQAMELGLPKAHGFNPKNSVSPDLVRFAQTGQ